MAIGDIYQVTLELTDNDLNTYNNVFSYLQTTPEDSGASSPQALTQAFRANFCEPDATAPLTNILSVRASVTRYSTINLFNPLEIAEQVFAPGVVVGQRTGQAMPPFVAYGFRSERKRRDIRRGFKRFAPTSEDDIGTNIPEPTFEPNLNAVATALETELIGDVAFGLPTYVPCVVKRIQNVPGDPSAGYRLPTNQAEAEFFTTQDWSFSNITSQNSRKLGR
jgi:hypothetical protein